MKPKVAKVYLSGISLIAIGFFFWVFLYQMFVSGRANVNREQVLFDQTQVKAFPGNPLKVNLFFQGQPTDKISAATVVMKYPQQLLEYDSTLGDTTVSSDPVESTCIANGYKLNQVLKVENDSQSGRLTITRIALEKDENLPGGLFCFGTVTFRTKQYVNATQGQINLSATGLWEIVGPKGSYRPQVAGANDHVSVMVP